MPFVNVMYWNLVNFGGNSQYKDNYAAMLSAVAHVAGASEIDVLFLQGIGNNTILQALLPKLQQQLNRLPEPMNNWYYDWIKGALSGAIGPWQFPFNLAWDVDEHEGYAVFVNVNLAKFTLQAAPPVPNAGGNLQSQGVCTFGTQQFGADVAPVAGQPVPQVGHVVPADPAYTIPAGTVAGPDGIKDAAVVLLAAGATAGAAIAADGGTVVSAGTEVGTGGITLTGQQYLNRSPVVVPGGFVLTEELTLPQPGAIVVPQNALSLVMEGRPIAAPHDTTVGDVTAWVAPFVPGGQNVWNSLPFTSSDPAATMADARRPCFITLDVNRAGLAAGAAARLLPLICYSAPWSNPACCSGMQRAAYSRPMYQAWSPPMADWVDSSFSVLGGDFFVEIDTVTYPYDAFILAFANGGAGCEILQAAPAPPGNGMTRANNPQNMSTVQIDNPPAGGVMITSTEVNDYRAFAVGNVFTRGFTVTVAGGGPWAPGNAPVVGGGLEDLLASALGDNDDSANFPPAVLQNFAALPVIDAILANAQGAGPQPPPTPELAVADLFAYNLFAGAIRSVEATEDSPLARRAAELIHLMISENLPITAKLAL